jgi:hypothetical protein
VFAVANGGPAAVKVRATPQLSRIVHGGMGAKQNEIGNHGEQLLIKLIDETTFFVYISLH